MTESSHAAETPRTAEGPIGIIGAMESEVAHLIAAMEVDEVLEALGTAFHHGSIDGAECVVVRCGIGKVNAALCAQLLVDRYGVSRIINSGVAGAISPELDVMDIVVSTDAVQHDMDDTPFGYEPGEVPGIGRSSFAADPRMVEAVRASAEEAFREEAAFEESSSGEAASGESAGGGAASGGIASRRVLLGRVASGDRFIMDEASKEFISRTFGAACCEMEGAAIAQAAYLNGVPFVIVRAISDKADGSADMSYGEFEKKAAKLCASIVQRTLPRIA